MSKRILFIYSLIACLFILTAIALVHGFYRPVLKTQQLANGHKQIVLVAADDHPAGYPTVLGLQFMAKRLRQLSDNKMTIHVYPGAQLGSEQDVIEQTLFGAIDVARLSTNALNHIDSDTTLLSLPYVFKSEDAMHRVLDGKIGQNILASFKTAGYTGLAFYDSGVRSFYNTKKPIYTPQDMQDLKIRVQASDVVVAMIKALGANPTTMDFGEVYNSLRLGDIDGAENNLPSYYSTKHYTVAHYFSFDQHTMVPEIVLMSGRSWRALTAQQQYWLRQAARESVTYMRIKWQAMTARARANMQKAGVKFNQVRDMPLWRQKATKIYAQFVTTPHLQSLLQDIKRAQA